ncbi:unnamed protein product, partial [Mesorhabditis spiculigera]
MDGGSTGIRQGFICPFCLVDLGSYNALAAHVENDHPEDANTPAVEQLKGFFDKAKRSIKRFDPGLDIENLRGRVSSGLTAVASSSSMTQIDETSPKQTHQNTPTTTRSKSRERELRQRARRPELPPYRPEIGVTQKHTEYYVRCREASVNDLAVRTNTLIIRMDKLINEAPADPAKRKGKLTNPALAAAMQDEDEESAKKAEVRSLEKLADLAQRTSGHLRGLIGSSKGSRDGTEVSISTLLRQDAAEQLRVCVPCLSLLEKRELQMEARNPPALVSIYERLIILLNEISNLSPAYAKMASSINNGEALYSLSSAEEIRSKIARKQQEIDLISKSIEGDETENMGFRERQLRKNIRFVAIQTLQNVISNMQGLPTAEKYAELAELHRRKVARQVEEQRAIAQRAATTAARAIRSDTSSPEAIPAAKMTPSSSFIGRSVDDGWTPELSHSLHNNPFAEQVEQKHPLEEQRDIIKGYLSQAAAAGRLEEVEMLERNLRDLEIAMREHQIHTP